MIIKDAVFIKSAKALSECPKPEKPEFAFLGRSNVGKSTLINTLTNNNKLAKTSVKPGKTKLINYFLINQNIYLVDLPGIGYAAVSKQERFSWQKMIQNYVSKRESLLNLYYLLDSRLKPQEIDIEFINWCGHNSIPIALVFTKTDKNSKNITKQNVEDFQQTLLKTWNSLPPIFTTSAINKIGVEELIIHIDETSKLFNKANE